MVAPTGIPDERGAFTATYVAGTSVGSDVDGPVTLLASQDMSVQTASNVRATWATRRRVAGISITGEAGISTNGGGPKPGVV
jgi:hypothetical protein